MKAVEHYMSLEQYDLRYWKDVRFLEKIVHNFAKKYYDFDTKIKVVENGRLGRALGRFIHGRQRGSSRAIDISTNFLKHATKEEIVGVILHEAIHHILFELGKDYKDGQFEFETNLRKHGAPSTQVLSPKLEREVYVCQCCQKVVATRTRKSSALTERYSSGCCKDKIVYRGREVI